MQQQTIEPGYCQCGCEEWIGFWEETDRPKGKVRGEPKRYVPGHNDKGRTPAVFRILDKINLSGSPHDCWEWTGYRTPLGYGGFKGSHANMTSPAHRVVYELLHGKVSSAYDLDHLCRNPSCVNPAHLEPVSHSENVRRGASTPLTWDDVTRIRAERRKGRTYQSIADDYGIDQSTVGLIVHEKHWPESERPKTD